MTHRLRATATSTFGVSRRESHDSSQFYARFTPPVLSGDDAVGASSSSALDAIICGDARTMTEVADSSVALVVTSPPYFAGKEYEEALGEGHVPSSYLDYLELLEEVFAECVRTLEPGGRIAVNVANLGRKPYRSLSADVISILQDLGFLLRGEIVWVKGKGAGSSCAWGSFQSAANPVLRDLSERIVVASKGRFDRARSRPQRAREGLPAEVSISKDEFMESTTDIWDLPPESASRVGHPAPFPVELPQRLIELYTYVGDVVLDPLAGSGTAAVAALRSGRRFIGYEIDEDYASIARRRVDEERLRTRAAGGDGRAVAIPALRAGAGGDHEDPVARGVREGRTAKELSGIALREAGFQDVAVDERVAGSVDVDFAARDRRGGLWLFVVAGGFTGTRGGLRRSDVLWKALGKAAVVRAGELGDHELVVLTTDLPPPGSPGDAALQTARGKVFRDVIEILSSAGRKRLREFARGTAATGS